MSRSLSKFLKIALPLGLGIFLIWYSYSRFSPEQIEEIKIYFGKADYAIVALSVFLSFLSHISRAYRWNFMLEPMGYKTKLANNFMAVYIAYLMNIFIPKSGEVSRAIVLDKYEKVPFEKGFGSIISERVVDLIFLFLFTIAALLIQFDVLFAYLKEVVEPTKMLFAMATLIALVVFFFLFMKHSKSNLRNKLKKFISGLKEGVFSILKMKKKFAFLLHTCIIWALYFLSFYTATHALSETEFISASTLIITFVVGSFAFAFTNSGFGSYPFFVAGILAVFGIAETAGTAFGWIVWTSSIASIIFFGGLSFLLLPVYNRVKL
ncbi:lysylphosphatidylglycerol synthase transmembrane domain-containing protein [Aequorivita echinoideorum]|uniref:Flippase-like domain-containing protein n=1 Tax=Aequorivita echinoideorum TaxID=1549647 RepID=A0ABS5S165_9FLAO|nr:lysylphosphatidylglycerol synthase transmembrane domain-containing protein [Aequorivita echinoideorum]MBT0606920.1 flippase-like domain-containing protein [Aequorivita echinoideorum]